MEEFHQAGAVVIGISGDSIKTHEKFAAQLGLTFPLLSDPDRTVISAYGALKEKSLDGVTFLGIERSTFVIDDAGTIRRIWRKVSVDGHASEVLEYVRGLSAPDVSASQAD